MRKIFILYFFLIAGVSAEAQDLNIYDWASLQCYRSGIDVTETPNNIVFNAKSGLVFIDKSNTDDIRHLTTIDGMTGSDILTVRYIPDAEKLFIYYGDGSFDLMDKNLSITSIQDIKNNNVLVPNKELNAAIVSGKYIYLCFSFGMVEYDAREEIFTNTLTAEGGISAVSVNGDKLYIINNNKLYTIDRSVKANISYLGNWTLVDAPDNRPHADETYRGLTTFRGQSYTTFDRNLYRLDENSGPAKIDTLPTIMTVAYLNAGAEYLMVGGSCNPAALDNKSCIGEVALFDRNLKTTDYSRQNLVDLRYVIETTDRIWFADSYHGYRYLDLPALTPGFIDINRFSPWSDKVDAIIKTNDALYIAPGAHTPNYQGAGYKDGLFEYKDGFWRIYNQFSDPFFASPRLISDLSNFAYNEKTGELAIASYTDGILSIKGDQKKLYYSDNSALQTVPGDPDNTRVSDVAFDSRGNLWATNVLSPTSIYVRTEDGADKGFSNNFGQIRLIDMAIDPVNEYIWCVEPSRGIIVYDPGENVLSANDDRWASFSVYSSFEKQNILPKCVYADASGRIWIGTVSGLFVEDCGSDIFTGNDNCGTRFPIMQDESGLGPFLYGQSVNVITEDGAGRKWIGTNNGIYVTNNSVDEVVLHLTNDNSPLADDNVTVLEIDKKAGIVYIGTRAGVQMYRTDASIGNPYHDARLLIYPNPVKPEYSGPIIIQGLAHDSDVKIADVNGKLVYETHSLGGQAIWYGKDFNGRKVGSGVYFVIGTTTQNAENPVGIIGKVVFVH